MLGVLARVGRLSQSFRSRPPRERQLAMAVAGAAVTGIAAFTLLGSPAMPAGGASAPEQAAAPALLAPRSSDGAVEVTQAMLGAAEAERARKLDEADDSRAAHQAELEEAHAERARKLDEADAERARKLDEADAARAQHLHSKSAKAAHEQRIE